MAYLTALISASQKSLLWLGGFKVIMGLQFSHFFENIIHTRITYTGYSFIKFCKIIVVDIKAIQRVRLQILVLLIYNNNHCVGNSITTYVCIYDYVLCGDPA